MKGILLFFGALIILSSFVYAGSYNVVYQETFDSNPNWTTNDVSMMYPTLFNGESVFRAQPKFMQDPPYNNQAYALITINGDSFKLEWDSYIESKQDNAPFIEFGIWNSDYLYDYAFGTYSGNTIISFLQGAGRGVGTSGVTDKWIHNVLTFTKLLPQNFGLLEFNVYDGRQNTNNLLGSTSVYGRYSQPSTERLGITFSNSGSLDPAIEHSVIYIDNVVMSIMSIDQDNDGVLDSEDKCPNTIGQQIVYGCSCEQILALKPGENTIINREGCSKGVIDVFTKAVGWAKDLF